MKYLDLSRIDYSGFDLSETAINFARQHSKCLSLTTSSVEDFRGNDGEFLDVVVFNEVLPHVAEPLETLDRFLRMLVPNGCAVVSLFQNSDEQANARVLTRLLEVEISIGRYTVIGCAAASDAIKNMRWNVYCLRGN